MMTKLRWLMVLPLLVLAANVQAGPATDQLGICLTDSLNGKERKSLAKWIFFGIAAHPEIATYANVTSADQTQSSSDIGVLITRLLTADCPQQTTAAIAEQGSRALEQAFGVVGQVAMQELMADPQVAASLSAFEAYLDKDKVAALTD